jgi:prenyltransferase beta subunit
MLKKIVQCLLGICFIFLWGATSAWSQPPAEKEGTIAYVRALQDPDGGFRPTAQARTSESSLRATTAAIRALKYFGGQPRDRDSCRRFVARCFDPTMGGFVDRPLTAAPPDVPTTAVGLMAVAELKMPADDYASAAVRFLGTHARDFEDLRLAAAGVEAIGRRPAQGEAWRDQVERMRNPDGTFGRGDGAARATAGAVVTLLRLGFPLERRSQTLRTLRQGQRQDGGFGKEGQVASDLESCYRVVRAFAMLREPPASPMGLRTFVARCRNADGGYGLAPGQSSSVGSTYFAGIILYWLDNIQAPRDPP